MEESAKGTLVNFLKNTPNLVQLRHSDEDDFIVEEGLLTGDLAYYLRILKIHFQDDLEFEIDRECLPIRLLEREAELLQLVRLKSLELSDYLNEKLPLSKFGEIIATTFTTAIESDFNVEVICFWLTNFPQLILHLGITNQKDALFIKKILFSGDNEEFAEKVFSESKHCSLDHFYTLLVRYSLHKKQIEFLDCHLNFITEYIGKNKHEAFKNL